MLKVRENRECRKTAVIRTVKECRKSRGILVSNAAKCLVSTCYRISTMAAKWCNKKHGCPLPLYPKSNSSCNAAPMHFRERKMKCGSHVSLSLVIEKVMKRAKYGENVIYCLMYRNCLFLLNQRSGTLKLHHQTHVNRLTFNIHKRTSTWWKKNVIDRYIVSIGEVAILLKTLLL